MATEQVPEEQRREAPRPEQAEPVDVDEDADPWEFMQDEGGWPPWI